MIGIIDYGLGNLRSIKSKLSILGYDSEISDSRSVLELSSHLILPGVGHFGVAMENIASRGLREVLDELVLIRRKPILGICLGFQLLSKFSEEGDVAGLGWINAYTRRYNFQGSSLNLRIPHVGWDQVRVVRDSVLFKDIPSDKRFYFTHSFFMEEEASSAAVAINEYGQIAVAAVEQGNIFGVQFHPEKSRLHGLKLIDNFIRFAK